MIHRIRETAPDMRHKGFSPPLIYNLVNAVPGAFTSPVI